MVSVHADQGITFMQLNIGQNDEIGENKYETSLLTATSGGGVTNQKDADRFNSELSKVSDSRYDCERTSLYPIPSPPLPLACVGGPTDRVL